MKKAIIFDFWGTLVEIGVYPSPVRQVKNILDIDIPFSAYIIKFEEVFMKKLYKNLYEAFTEVCKEFHVEPKKEILDELVGLWNKNKLLAKPFPETLGVLEELKENAEGWSEPFLHQSGLFVPRTEAASHSRPLSSNMEL